MAGQRAVIATSIRGLDLMAELPPRLQAARERFLRNAGEALAHDVEESTPRRSGRLRRSISSKVIGISTVLVGSFGTDYAAAINRGAMILPRKGRQGANGRRAVLRFVVGGEVLYRPRALIRRNRPGGKFFERGLVHRRATLNRVFRETYGKL
ncbi:MAG: hypothetical protein ACJ76I_11850 [Gaiellaceae bacterium]